MKTMIRSVLFSLIAVFAMFGQITTTTTTLAGSLAADSRTLCLNSSTGVSVPGFGSTALTGLFVDREFMVVNSATSSSLCWNVTRGFQGTAAFAHNNAAVVYVGPTGGSGGSPFRNSDPAGGSGSPCVATREAYLPQVTVGSSQNPGGMVWSCPATGTNALLWQGIQLPVNAQLAPFYVGLESGANNALVVSLPGLTQTAGVCLSIKLAHTLQAGANTIALNGGTATALKSHFNIANNIGTVYAATGTLTTCFDGTQWTDSAQ